MTTRMKPTLLAAALVGVASADLHIPVDVLRRDDNGGNLIDRADPTVDDPASTSCSSLATSFYAALPEGPTVFPEFSSNYYKTVSRTATATEEDCAWITELPESTYQQYREWNTRAKAFRDDPANGRFRGIWEECQVKTSPGKCSTEWLAYVDEVIDGTVMAPSPKMHRLEGLFRDGYLGRKYYDADSFSFASLEL